MDDVMVTFHADGQIHTELKLPVYVKISDLLAMLAESLPISIAADSQLQAEPLGRILDPNLTLKEEGVRRGAMLTLI